MSKTEMLERFADTATVTAMGEVVRIHAVESGNKELERQTRDALAALVVELLVLTVALREAGATEDEFLAALDTAEEQFAAKCAAGAN